MLLTDLFFGIYQSTGEREDAKTYIWDQNWPRFIRSCV